MTHSRQHAGSVPLRLERGRRASYTCSRRQLMGLGMGSLATAMPLLASLRSARAGGAPIRRFVFVYTPNGTVPEEFWPTSGEGEAFDTLGAITAPFESLRSRLLFLRGLDLSVTSIGPGGPHQRGMGALLTGRELQNGDFVGGDGSHAGWANGQSLDQHMGAVLRDETLFGTLELGVRATSAEVRGRLSYAGPAEPLPPINTPLETYQRVFSGVVDLEPSTRARRVLVSSALQELYGAVAPQVSVADRQKFEQHQDALSGIERRLEQLGLANNCSSPSMPAAMAEDDEETMVDVTRLQFDLLATALACDVTRVATVQLSDAINDIRFPWIDSMGTGHSLSHAGDSDESARAQLIARGAWYAEQIAHFVSKLADIPDGEGTLLDSTIVLWGNELGIGNVHSLTDIPFLMIGGGGYFGTERLVNFGGAPHNRLLVSIAQAMGLSMERFGHPDMASGALPGLAI